MSAGTRVITPQQYSEGWLERRGMVAYQHGWQVLRVLDDGNYLVVDPARSSHKTGSETDA